MKKIDKLAVALCLDELRATVSIASKPLPRKAYLMARRWHKYQQGQLEAFGYRGKIDRLPKHKLKKGIEEVPEVRDVQEIQIGRIIEIFTR